MNLREPNGTPPERYCDECRTGELVRATRVVSVRYNDLCLCEEHFVELSIMLSLAVTEEHPDEQNP